MDEVKQTQSCSKQTRQQLSSAQWALQARAGLTKGTAGWALLAMLLHQLGDKGTGAPAPLAIACWLCVEFTDQSMLRTPHACLQTAAAWDLQLLNPKQLPSIPR
jgi:hypothetical protein